MIGHALLLSIKPRFADAIFARTKRVELRRVKPRVQPGDLVLVYVTSPRCTLEGAFEVERVFAEPPLKLWQHVHEVAGITKEEFTAYFADCDMAYGIVVRRAWKLAPVSLAALRKAKIRPPQSYQYLDPSTTIRLTLGAKRSKP
jgi:predicted transcriptional regulator